MCNNVLKPLFSTGNRKNLLLLPLISLLASCGITEDTGSGANPGAEEFPIAYVKRIIPVDDDGMQVQTDLRDPLLSMPGGDLYLRPQSSIGAPEINITGVVTNGLGDVKDVDVSSDGKKLVFSLRPEDPDPNDNIEPKWDIYTYDRITEELKRVIASDISAAEGDDLAPFFLADGRIVFSSNRQSQSRAILLDEDLVVSKPQFSSTDEENDSKALVLHVMNADGSDIKQISFNQSHDLDASVLSDGRILFSRWDRANNSNAISLYTIYPDGTGLQAYYGLHDESHQDAADNTIQLVQARELADGRVMAMSQPYTDTFAGGEIVIIDVKNYVDLNQPTTANVGAVSGPASEKATATNVILDGLSVQGRYAYAYPLKDSSNRMLVSKGLCQVGIDVSPDPMLPMIETHPCTEPYLSDPRATEVYPSYGVWLYDRSTLTEKPIVIADDGMMITDAVAMQPSDNPQNLPLKTLDPALVSENVGLLKIRSVYDFGGSFDGCIFGLCTSSTTFTDPLSLGDPLIATADQRPARFIRIVKAVGIPDDNDPDLANPPDLSNRAFGRNRRLGMKEIIGYNEIQPDGSVIVKVPANIAFYFEVLDKDARRIGPRHDNWLQVNAGDTIECNGCHTHNVTDPALPLPHGRNDAEPASANTGAPSDGFSYPNTQNPATLAPYSFSNAGDTMAEVLQRTQAANNVSTSTTLSLDVNYTDIWTDPAVTTPTEQFSYVYSDRTIQPSGKLETGLTTLKPLPILSSCETTWNSSCRIVINYEEHIHPLWSVARPGGSCVSCHSFTAGDTEPPAAQLDLSGDISDEEVQHIESYRDLFFNDNFQQVVGGVLTDVLITVPALDDDGNPILDINGNPTFEDIPDPDLEVSPSMSPNGARASYFMEKMTETELNAGRTLSPATVNHANMLTPAEMRLIAEWLDIGGQYFNNPFHPNAPEN